MLIHHYVPSVARRVGGLDTALQGLNRALEDAGVTSLLMEDGSWRVRHPLPDVAHFHGLWNLRHCWLAAMLRRKGVPTVISPHGMLEPWALAHRGWKKRPFFRLLEEPRLRAADAVLATSALEQGQLGRLLPRTKLVTLPLGLDVPAEAATPLFRSRARTALGLADTTPMVLFLSRIDPKKGIDLLLLAWKALAPLIQEKQAVLFVVGGGEGSVFERHCRGLADDCAAAGAAVRWVGPVWGEGRWNYFAAADLLCLPSHSENFGFVVPEAWCCGTPVLTTPRTPWGKEAAFTKLGLCEPEAVSIGAALERWFAREPAAGPDRSAMAAEAREQHAWRSTVPGYLKFYATLHHEAAVR